MSQNTKYITGIVAALFIFTAGYSGWVIYQNKHNHTGSRFSLINFITGKDSTPASLKNSSEATQITKQNAQYAQKGTKVTLAAGKENDQRQIVLSFFSEYLQNKQDNKSQEATLAKYGTANLASLYKNAPASYDPITCATEGSGMASPTAAAISSVAPIDNYMNYALQFSDAKNSLISDGQAQVVGTGSASLVDSTSCLLPN